GGMTVVLVSVFVVPVLFCAVEELKARWKTPADDSVAIASA
ncbi:MAG: hypothetical protein ACI9SE_001126, partial [Neolewinella sp.]